MSILNKVSQFLTGSKGIAPRIFLGAYDYPTRGQWVILGKDHVKTTLSVLQQKYPQHTEWGIMDMEGLPTGIDENVNVHSLDFFVEIWLPLEDHEKAIIEYMSNHGYSLDQMIEAIQEQTLYEFSVISVDNSQLSELAQRVHGSHVEETVPNEYQSYIDWKKLGNDTRITYGYSLYKINDREFWVAR